ncbi:hypothetical protein MY10362_005187 [Beauveria mimosiformis]
MSPPNQTPPPHLGQQQQQHQPPHHQHSHSSGSYGPPPPRPPAGVAPPPPHSSFGSGRDLPAFNSLTRSSPGAGSSMSISSMLGGPPPASRESQPRPPHYSPHSAPPTASASQYGPSVHASPRMHSASSDYNPFRRPQTPDHQRNYDPRGSAAPSPRGHYATTPDVQRYGTPQSYHARHPSAPAETGRDPGRVSTGPSNTPGNQSKPFSNLPRPIDLARAPQDDRYVRLDERHGADYLDRATQRHYPFDDRYRLERDRQPGPDQREREAREHAYAGGEPRHGPPELNPRNQSSYPRHPEPTDRREPPRDQHWARQGPEHNYRAPMDHQRAHPEYPPASGPYQPQGPAYQTAPPPQHQDRYAPTSHPHPHPQASAAASTQPYDSPERAPLDRQPPAGRAREDQHQQIPPGYHNPAHGPAPYDAARHRNGDDQSSQIHQRNLLGVQDMNRKGRMSPLPQAVQGAQPQQPGPAGEPGIKSEFGRMFAGIGSGVGNMGASNPVTSAPSGQVGAGALGKDEDHAADGTKKPRRRKLKDDIDRPDDESTGRRTPVGRGAKRVKGHHHHQYVSRGIMFATITNAHYSHHHHHHAPDSVSSPLVGITPLKNGKSNTPLDNAGDKTTAGTHHHHHHHHHHHTGRSAQSSTPQPKPAEIQAPVMPPKTKTTVSSKAVLDSIAHKTRHHLGDFVYETEIKAGRLVPRASTNRGFASQPKPLPLDRIKGKENSILTIKVPRVHLMPVAREEITARAFVWGTDVYTDDSDPIAACIHSGWIMGEWTEDVDTCLFNLDNSDGVKETKKPKVPVELTSEGVISSPPKSGPMPIPANRDLHINVLIVPRLVKYAGCTRYGLTSREFGGEFGSRHAVHDGVSYMIQSVRWVANGGQPQARLRGQARRDRMRKAMIEVNASLGNISSQERALQRERLGKLRSEISGSWWKQAEAGEGGGGENTSAAVARDPPTGAEADKENQATAVNGKASTGAVVVELTTGSGDKDVDMGEGEASNSKDADEKGQVAA